MSTPQNILVVDVEATCWNDNRLNPRNEIIEIGIAVIDIKTKTLTESRSIIVTPPTTEISAFCTQLTTLTPEFVQAHGIPFKNAMDICRSEYKMHRNVFASWGDYDRKAFEKTANGTGSIIRSTILISTSRRSLLRSTVIVVVRRSAAMILVL